MRLYEFFDQPREGMGFLGEKNVEENDLDKFKKYIRPVVKTTPKIERTTNPAGRTTDHVEYKVTTPTGEIHRYKSKKQAQEHFDSFGSQGVTEGLKQQYLWPGSRQKIPMYQPIKDEITEAFDYPYKLKWEKSNHGDVDASATLDDGNYLNIMFNRDENEDGELVWNVEFDRNYSQAVTGEGDAQRVFATVLSAIQTFIKKYKPLKLTFAASKEVDQGQNSQSRARLYDSLVQRYARAWGYKAFRADTGNLVVYEFSRIQKLKAVGEDYTGQFAKEGVAEGSQEINWVKPNFDFEWHEVEEQSKMKQVPVDVRQYYQKHFPNKDAWLKAVQNGKAVVVPPDHAYEIRNAPFDKASLQKVLAPTGHEGPIGPAKEKRVNDLFDKGQVEMPIILKTSQGLWLIGGKTRLGTANYVKGLPAKVWLISGKQGVAEGSESGPVEAYGYRYNNRDQRIVWRKIFPSGEAAYAWADRNNATVLGTRSTEQR